MSPLVRGILLALAIAGFGFLLITYVPGIKFWEKQRVADSAVRDSIQIARKRAEKAEKELLDYKIGLARDKERSDANQKAVAATIKLDVSGLSAIAQRTANLESLIRSGLLTAKDTAKATPVVSYNQPANQALTIQLRICDSLKEHAVFVERAHSALHRAYDQRGDSMKLLQGWIQKGKWIADKKGWFTGKNKELREHANHPPVFK